MLPAAPVRRLAELLMSDQGRCSLHVALIDVKQHAMKKRILSNTSYTTWESR